MAIENMNGQFFGGKQISVQYAFKKDGKGERHGTQAERLLAAQAKFVLPLPPTAPDLKRLLIPGNKLLCLVDLVQVDSPIKVCHLSYCPIES